MSTTSSPSGQAASRRRDPQDLTRKGRRTRKSLVDAARAVFYEQGYIDARLSEVTERAGVSTGTLYTYFDDREQLLAAIIDDAYARSVRPAGSRPADVRRPVPPDLQRQPPIRRGIPPELRSDGDLRSGRIPRRSAQGSTDGACIRLRTAQCTDHPQTPGRRRLSTAGSSRSSPLRHCHSWCRLSADTSTSTNPTPAAQMPLGAQVLADHLTRLWFSALGVDPDPLLHEVHRRGGPDPAGAADAKTSKTSKRPWDEQMQPAD